MVMQSPAHNQLCRRFKFGWSKYNSPSGRSATFLYAVKRKVVGIWGCKDCGKVKVGGAYTLNTTSVVTVRSTIRRSMEQTEG